MSPGQFGMTERLYQISDVEAKKAEEERILIFGVDGLAFVDGIAD